MIDRESILPLTIGAVVAVLVHILLLPAMAQSLRNDSVLQAWPDLQVDSLGVPSRMVSGRDVSIILAVINKGGESAAITVPVATRIILSKDATISEDDVLLIQHVIPASPLASPLPANQPATHSSITTKLPIDSHGARFLIATIDPDNQINEGPHEGNNTLVLPIQILSPEEVAKPDLVLLAAAAPSSAKPGEMIAVDFSIGGATDSEPVVLSYFDGVFLSADDRLSSDDALLTVTPGPDAVLTAGQAYSRKAEVRIDPSPSALANRDRMYLLFVADHLNRVAELSETNNTFARPIRIIRPDDPQPREEEKTAQGTADLHIPVLSSPHSVMNGESLNIDAIIANRGDGATKGSPWRDQLFLSKDEKLDDSDALIATAERTNPLAAGGYYSLRMTGRIDLPEKEAGAMFLILKTDAGDAVEESDETNNIHMKPIQIDQVAIGKDKPDEDRTTVAWIPYDDFRKLMARSSETEQPALQSKVDPVQGAPTPRDPSPPSPPQPQPVEEVQAKKQPEPKDVAQAAKQKQPTEETADAAKQIEAKSPVTTPSQRAVTQPKTEAIAMLPVAPRPQPAADGPAQAGNPIKQPEAQTPKPSAGNPTTQTEIALPTPIAPTLDPSAAFTKPDATASESRDPAKSDVTTTPTTPTQLPRADAPMPTTGNPTKLEPSVAPPSTEGSPTKLLPSETPDPSKTGKPTTSPAQEGAEQPQPKPAASSDDKAKATPKAVDEKTKKPVPPTQPSNPTSAPRDEADSPPTILEDRTYSVEPGGVITRPGIQIVTTIPDITTPSWLVSGPTAVNPIIRITFDRQGVVRKIDVIRSSGHANLDSPIKAAFFNFRAKGESLKRVRDTFSIEIKLLLKNERE